MAQCKEWLSITKWLNHVGYAQYIGNFKKAGYDRWDIIQDLKDKDYKEQGIKSGHAKRLVRLAREYQQSTSTRLQSNLTGSLQQQSAQCDILQMQNKEILNIQKQIDGNKKIVDTGHKLERLAKKNGIVKGLQRHLIDLRKLENQHIQSTMQTVHNEIDECVSQQKYDLIPNLKNVYQRLLRVQRCRIHTDVFWKDPEWRKEIEKMEKNGTMCNESLQELYQKEWTRLNEMQQHIRNQIDSLRAPRSQCANETPSSDDLPQFIVPDLLEMN